ncbi:hypothetical protein C8J56DRAFT_971794 [Mycena floridula]|nr:hypothetical protein C8J56DRAFT_971794 [Mycena floridula]
MSSSSQGDPRVVLILVGLIGSESTFAHALEKHFNFRRCNQDDLGNRRAVEDWARTALRQGLSVCIDRTNFNPSQRAYWIDIAREFPGTEIWVIVFDIPYDVCATRLKARTSHPTIKTPEQALSVLSRFASDFVSPDPSEGYHRILVLRPSETPLNYTHSDIDAILGRLRDSPLVSSGLGFFRNFPGNSFRGGASGRGHYHRRGGAQTYYSRSNTMSAASSAYHNNAPATSFTQRREFDSSA